MKINIGEEVCDIINLCWHPVTVRLPDGEYHWEKCHKDRWARVDYKKEDIGGGLFKKVPIGIANLPEPKPGVRYIVSEKVLRATRDLGCKRDDLLAPGHQRPDANRKVKYCEGFQVVD